jgi:hypothetical protein
MRNIHPTYELAMVRADIDRLRQREAFLRRGFLGDTLPRHGDEAVVEIAVFRSRRFLRDKLPPGILENEAYWGTQRTEHVKVRPR